MNAFTVVFGGLLAFFVITVLLLGLFSKRSAREILDWKPTRSPEVEAQNELDDVAQMIAAQNELKRRRGAPDRIIRALACAEWTSTSQTSSS